MRCESFKALVRQLFQPGRASPGSTFSYWPYQSCCPCEYPTSKAHVSVTPERNVVVVVGTPCLLAVISKGGGISPKVNLQDASLWNTKADMTLPPSLPQSKCCALWHMVLWCSDIPCWYGLWSAVVQHGIHQM